MVLQVEASESGVAEAREIKIDAAQDSVDSVVAAVGEALGVKLKELSMWDEDFEDWAKLDDHDELFSGAKIVVELT